jgi:hypothetical protein
LSGRRARIRTPASARQVWDQRTAAADLFVSIEPPADINDVSCPINILEYIHTYIVRGVGGVGSLSLSLTLSLPPLSRTHIHMLSLSLPSPSPSLSLCCTCNPHWSILSCFDIRRRLRQVCVCPDSGLLLMACEQVAKLSLFPSPLSPPLSPLPLSTSLSLPPPPLLSLSLLTLSLSPSISFFLSPSLSFYLSLRPSEYLSLRPSDHHYHPVSPPSLLPFLSMHLLPQPQMLF